MDKIYTQLKFNNYMIFFLITFALFFLSSVLSPYYRDLSFFLTVSEYSFLAWLFLTIIVVRISTKGEISKMFVTFFLILYGLLIFEAGVTYLQFLKHSPLGLTVEKVETIPSFGYGADESRLQFRPVGLNYHANSLANYQISLLATLIILWLFIRKSFSKKISEILIISSCCLSLSIIVLTLSRSAYLSIFFFSLFVVIINYERSLKILKRALIYFEKYKFLVLIISLFFIYTASNRILNSVYAFAETGGLTTRAAQIQEAVSIFRSTPLFGVGNGMFISALYDFNPQGLVRYFPEYVHNGIVLLLTERGIIAAFAYLIGIYYLLRMVLYSNFTKITKTIMVSGIVSTYTMMLFQPFLNLFSLNILVTSLVVEANIHAEKD